MNKLSILIEEQFPDYYKENGTTLIDFLEAYYEWGETTGQIDHSVKNLLNFRHIDTTTNRFLKYFEEEFLANIPTNVVVDKRLLAKHAQDLWQAKGTERAFKLLFRILYNEDLEVYLPQDNILRASDGNWVEEKAIRVEFPSNPDKVFNMNQLTITGATSGATAIVENVNKVSASSRVVFDLFLSNIYGSFQDGEVVTDSKGQNATVLGVLTALSVIDGGAFNQKNDSIIATLSGLKPTRAKVASIDNQSAIKFVLSGGGSGYRNAANTTLTVSGGSGLRANLKILTVSNDDTLRIPQDQIGALAAVPIDALTQYGAHPNQNSANYTLSANLSSSNVSTQFVTAWGYFTANIGSIQTIKTTDYGYNYNDSVPSVTATDEIISDLSIPDGSGGIKGRNATIQAQYVNGAIETLSVDVKQTDIDYGIGNTVTFQNDTRSPTANGFGTVSGKTGIFSFPGKYQGTRGWLSSDMRLQDNDYYQQYSYVLVVRENLKTYKEIVKNTIHPAGMRMFGQYEVLEKNQSGSPLSSSSANASAQIWESVNGYAITVSGNSTITGVGTNFSGLFTATGNVVINTANSGLFKIVSIANTTSMVVRPTPTLTIPDAKVYKAL